MGRSLKPATPFAQRLILARGDTSRADVAKALGCPLETLGNYERGRTFPDQDMLRRLKDVLGVSLDWLVTGNGSMQCPSLQKAQNAGLDEAFYAQIIDGLIEAMRGLGLGIEVRAVATLAASWYNDLIVTCTSDEERSLGLRLMLRQFCRQHRG